MSVSSVAGPNLPRSWTPILNRRDDSAQTASPNSPDQSGNSPQQTGAPTSPFLGKTSSVTDSIMVSLPNGMSVGIAHFGAGSSGFDAQMLASLEDLVSNLSAYSPSSNGTADETKPGAASDGSKNTGSNNDLQGSQAIDMMHVDLPNGISVEIRHNSASGDADGGVAAMNEMEKAMEELVDHFSGLGDHSAGSGSTANPTASQRALAAYTEQAKQTDQTALAAGLGVSRAS
jgi:hypothetical protein